MNETGQANVVWLPPSATEFSCLCERCLDSARATGSFLDAVRVAAVRGRLPPDAELAVARCSAGHQIVLRRGARPPALARHDDRQLQIGGGRS
jgi:hypothetical protein